MVLALVVREMVMSRRMLGLALEFGSGPGLGFEGRGHGHVLGLVSRGLVTFTVSAQCRHSVDTVRRVSARDRWSPDRVKQCTLSLCP